MLQWRATFRDETSERTPTLEKMQFVAPDKKTALDIARREIKNRGRLVEITRTDVKDAGSDAVDRPASPRQGEAKAPSVIYPFILCGGAGTRLWPVSRESMPKQFARLVEDKTSIFQSTVLRVVDQETFGRLGVLAHVEARFLVSEQLAQIETSADILLEPERRDSAAAVAVAALHAAQADPETVVLIMAADHVIGDTAAFIAAVKVAARGARAGYIMTLGVVPTHAATDYGYIRRGAALADAEGAQRVAQFIEKPDVAGADQLLAEGALWNSGYFLFRADVMLAELEMHAPAILAAARASLRDMTRDLDFVRLDAEAFRRAPKTSIDYAVMEHTRQAGVVPVSFPWSDVGSWTGLWEVLPHDAAGNVVRGRAEVVNTSNSLVHSEGDQLTTVIGLSDIVVVSTPDAVLVTSKSQSGTVKELVQVLRKKACPEADAHRRIYRPWGWYQRIDMGDRFQVKRIMVTPAGQLSLQRHFHRAEHWVVVKGTAEVTVNERVVLVHENEAVYLPIGSMHRLYNPGRIPLELIEVQVGSYTGEDDIVRVADVYGR